MCVCTLFLDKRVEKDLLKMLKLIIKSKLQLNWATFVNMFEIMKPVYHIMTITYTKLLSEKS